MAVTSLWPIRGRVDHVIDYGSALVPFVNRFPKDTELYQLMTTKPGEGHFSQGQV